MPDNDVIGIDVISRSRDGKRAQIVVLTRGEGGRTISTTKHVHWDRKAEAFVCKGPGPDQQETYSL